MSLTNSLISSLTSKETSNTAAWAIILAGGAVLPGSVGAIPAIENFPIVDARIVHEISQAATSPSVSFVKIEFNKRPEVDFLPTMPLKQIVKAKVVRERTMNFSSELFD